MPRKPLYGKSVFLNFPFDEEYADLQNALIFAVIDCGFAPRCALEYTGSEMNRLHKISRIIAGCRCGIHDISRTELDRTHNLPRFNMPFELGIFFGAKLCSDSPRQKQKRCLVMDADAHRYQKFLSDLAGHDIAPHGGSIETLIKLVRNWLSEISQQRIPGDRDIHKRYNAFCIDRENALASYSMSDSPSYAESVLDMDKWIKSNPLGRHSSGGAEK